MTSEQKPYIVVVEPDAQLAQTYAAAFERAGFDAKAAFSAQMAIDVADDRRPDCVVLELQLPAHNGVEFLHELRSYGEWQGVPVIVNTHTPRSHFVQMKDALQTLGVVDVLYKPQTTLTSLVAAIRSALAASKTEQKQNSGVQKASTR